MSRQIFIVPELEHDNIVYMAGLIDGEGCFYIAHKIKNMLKSTYSPQFKIVLTNQEVIVWMADKLKRSYTHILGSSDTNQHETYIVRISDRIGLIKFIEQILPYLIVKKDIAQTILDFCKSRVNNWDINNSRKMASTYSKIELDLFNKTKTLNQVGFMKGGY
jgi:hypothetical protein